MKRLFAFITAVVLCVALCSCGEEPPAKSIFSVGYTAFDGVFSPFYAEAESDLDVVEMTQLQLLSTDRAGNVVLNGIAGEKTVYHETEYTYNGPADVTIITNGNNSSTYCFTLREDLKFSDGTPLTADDVIFTMYVLCDPTYDGPVTFSKLPIAGLLEYQSGVTEKWKLILKDTPKNAVQGSNDGFYTAEEALDFWSAFNKAGEAFAQDITDWVIGEELGEDVYTAATAIGYTDLPETATTTDLFNAIVDRYGYDLKKIDGEQKSLSFSSILASRLKPELLLGVTVGETAETITGITKTGDYSFQVELTEAADDAFLNEFCFYIASMQYYGNLSKGSEETVATGGAKTAEEVVQFTKGDLRAVREKNAKPLGAGAYTFRSYDGNAVCFDANAVYYLGKPKTDEVLFKKIRESQMITHLRDDAIDLAEIGLNEKTVSVIEQVNGGVLNGDVLRVRATEVPVYGYVGVRTDRFHVDAESDSARSQYLQQAFVTAIVYYQQDAVAEYYKSNAEVFTRDVFDKSGNAIDSEEKLLKTLREYLAAAGYTFKNGKAVTAPTGAQLSYRAWFVGNAIGFSPAQELFTKVEAAFDSIGIRVSLRDLIFEDSLRSGMRSGMVELWCAEEREEFTMENAIVLPLYEQSESLIYRVASVDVSTLPADTTAHYRWLREIEKIQILS